MTSSAPPRSSQPQQGARTPVPRPHLPRHLHATETAVEVTTVAHRLGGGAATYADSRLLRALNDIQAVQQHYQFAREHRIELACALTGITDRYPPYIT
jgi:NADPH-dependent ferric siderophore reductase